MLLHVYDFLGFAKTLAEKANLNMEFTHSKHTAYTDGTTIYIPYPKSSWKEEDVVRWKFMIYHECYHNQPENKADLQIPIIHNFKTNSLLGMIFNVVIDHNIELREFNKGYEGANRAMEEFYKLRVDSIRNKSLYNVIVDEKNAATLATILYAFDCRFEWLLQAYKQDLSPFISNKVLKYYEKLKEVGGKSLFNNFLKLKNAGEENYKLAYKIYKILQSEELKKEEEKNSTKSNEAEKPALEVTELVPHNIGNKKLTELPAYNKKQSSKDYVIKTQRVFKSPLKDTNRNHTLSGTSREEFNKSVQEYDDYAIVESFKKLLRYKNLEVKDPGYITGSIRASKLWKGATGNPYFWDRKSNRHSYKNTAVLLLVDTSGSMKNLKYAEAVKSTLALANILNLLNINFEVAGFTHYSGFAEYIIHKEFNVKANIPEIKKSMITGYTYLWDNSDGESLLFGAKRLLNQNQKRKILVILSDGFPQAATCIGNEYLFTKEVIELLESKLLLVAVGILTDYVASLYKNNIVIKNVHQLEENLLTLVDRIL